MNDGSYTLLYKKLISRWDSERELSLRRHRIHALQNTIDSCINSATDRRGYVLGHRLNKFSEIMQCNSHYAVQGHSLSPILVPIESSYTTSYLWLWRYIIFFKMPTIESENLLPAQGLGFSNGTHFGMSKSICTPNFNEISQSMTELLYYFRFLKTESDILKFYFRFRFWYSSVIGVSFWIGLPNFVKIEPPQQSYDVMSIFKKAAGSHNGFGLGHVRPPTNYQCWSTLGPEVWFWSDLRYCGCCISAFWLEIAHSRSLWGFLGHISPNDVSYPSSS